MCALVAGWEPKRLECEGRSELEFSHQPLGSTKLTVTPPMRIGS
jgi:hypothetical protein